MSNITLSIDDELLAQSRSLAAKQGTSLNNLIRQLLANTINKPDRQDWFDGFALISEQSLGNSNGWKFDREELYDGRA